jgi:hypothetical protein
MTRNVLITAQTEKAICVGANTWIARSEIVEMIELDEPSKTVDCGKMQRIGIPYAIAVTEKAAGRAGW